MNRIRQICCALLLSGLWCTALQAQENQSYILHVVEKGQSLYSIASMYGVSQDEIVRLNPGSDQRIYAGRSLRIPRQADNQTQTGTFHTIQAGETLYRLGVKYNVSAQAICQANPGLSASNFRTGQVIRIPQTQATPNEAAAQTTPSQAAVGTTPSEQSQVRAAVKPNCRDMHRVKRKETIYSISREYGISEAQLIAANPELKGAKKLQKGAFLCIPYPSAASPTPSQPATPATDQELLREQSQSEVRNFSTLKAAVVLPLLDGVPQNEASRMVEYYEGFLMAVDSLKRLGTNIDLYTYNSGPESSSMTALLEREKELKQMHVIFGPLHPAHVKPLASFSQKHGIRLVVPFTARDNSVFSNSAVYQINTPQSYLYSEVYDHFTRQFPNANVIFIEATQGVKEKAEFVKGLKEELRNHGIPMQSVGEAALSEELKPLLRTDRENIFIPTSGSNPTLIKILPQLTLLVRENPECNIHLFGYPEWQTYTKDHLEAFFELDTYFYTSFYTNDLLPSSKQFTRGYRRWYAKEMEDRYPKYGMLGFDTGFFFLQGLARYGTGLENNLSRVNLKPIQTGFKFQRVNNWGGFINKKVFFVRFSKNFELLKLDFD